MKLAETCPARRGTPPPRRSTILAYHAIADVASDPHRICVSPRRLEAQMRYLKRCGLRGVSMRDLIRAEDAGRARRLVGLTFDDAYENFIDNALPILERHGFTATVFVLGAMLGAHNTWDEEPRMRLMGPEAVRAAARRGTEVGSHGMRHVGLAGLSPARREEELSESRRVLEDLTGETVEGFCYPYGSVDRAAVRAVREAGYAYACATWTRAENDAYDLPRMPVWEMDRSPLLRAKLGSFPLYSRVISGLARL